MATVQMLRPYVEKTVAEFLGLENVEIVDDGDILIRAGSAISFAQLLDGPTGPMFRVFSPLLTEVKKSPQLFERLNDLNSASAYIRFFWADDVIYCATEFLAETLQPDDIVNGVGVVSWHADQLDDFLQSEFGGQRMREEEEATKLQAWNPSYL